MAFTGSLAKIQAATRSEGGSVDLG